MRVIPTSLGASVSSSALSPGIRVNPRNAKPIPSNYQSATPHASTALRMPTPRQGAIEAGRIWRLGFRAHSVFERRAGTSLAWFLDI